MEQQKRFLSLKEVKKTEGEEEEYIGVYEVINDLKFADLFRSLKYKIGLIYTLSLEAYSILELVREYPNKQELVDLVKADRFLKENDSIEIDFLAEGREIEKFLSNLLEPFVEFLSLLPDTIAFYYSVYQGMSEELWRKFSTVKELVDGLCSVEHPYLPQDVIKTVLEKKIFIAWDNDWKEKIYPLVKHLLPESGKRFFSLRIQEFYDFLKEVVTKILSGEELEYVHKKIKFVHHFHSFYHAEPVESGDG